ncbi:MAG: endolytic transglycosylase MltG [Lachnospiraceae bacterium]|jgi:UPF0755 protein|nr:endolytic transglycosylase MltG [Lachnospiraceae bacterium]
MEFKQVIGAILSAIIRITIVIAVIYFVYQVGIRSYNFGYRVFADVAVEISPGRDKTVSVKKGKSVMETGKMLVDAGLIADEKVFFVQELLSEYHGKIKPGVYVLNTSMTGTEMLAVMSDEADEEEEETEAADDKKVVVQDNAGEDASPAEGEDAGNTAEGEEDSAQTQESAQ